MEAEDCAGLFQDKTVNSELHNMYVTSKDVDAVIKRLSFMVSEALNIAFHSI